MMMNPYDEVKEFIRENPGVTRNAIVKNLPHIKSEKEILSKMIVTGEIRRERVVDKSNRFCWGYFIEVQSINICRGYSPLCQISRVVKAVDSKSIGVDRHRFESCIWHHMLQLSPMGKGVGVGYSSPYYSILKSHIIR